MDMMLIDFLVRWTHILFGIAWIGLLYYLIQVALFVLLFGH